VLAGLLLGLLLPLAGLLLAGLGALLLLLAGLLLAGLLAGVLLLLVRHGGISWTVQSKSAL
jgi:hypothetical protein